MKEILTLAAMMALISCSNTMVKPETVSATDEVATVTLINPHNFTDIDTGNFGVQSNFEQRVAKELAEALADHFKETDLIIDIMFTDIDLAGETRYNMREIRVLKNVYIPRMSFEYEIKDKSGVVKLADTVDIKDMSYLDKRLFGIKANDLFRYEKRMLIEYFNKVI